MAGIMNDSRPPCEGRVAGNCLPLIFKHSHSSTPHTTRRVAVVPRCLPGRRPQLCVFMDSFFAADTASSVARCLLAGVYSGLETDGSSMVPDLEKSVQSHSRELL